MQNAMVVLGWGVVAAGEKIKNEGGWKKLKEREGKKEIIVQNLHVSVRTLRLQVLIVPSILVQCQIIPNRRLQRIFLWWNMQAPYLCKHDIFCSDPASGGQPHEVHPKGHCGEGNDGTAEVSALQD